jgi:hypothetical protein
VLRSLGIDLTGWGLGTVFAIDPDGITIAGTGTHNGNSEAWVASLLTGPRPGDANQDGIVNNSDLRILAGNLGMRGDATWTHGDFDGDRAVTLRDLGTLKRQFGRTTPDDAQAVPEPMAWLMAMAGGFLLGWRLNRRSCT